MGAHAHHTKSLPFRHVSCQTCVPQMHNQSEAIACINLPVLIPDCGYNGSQWPAYHPFPASQLLHLLISRTYNDPTCGNAALFTRCCQDEAYQYSHFVCRLYSHRMCAVARLPLCIMHPTCWSAAQSSCPCWLCYFQHRYSQVQVSS